MNLIDGMEWGSSGVEDIALRARELAEGSSPIRHDGLRLGCLFLNSSLRTRASIEAGASALGISPIILQPGKDSWALETREGAVMDGNKPEHIKDAVRVLAGFVDLLAVRAFAGMTSLEEDLQDPILSSVAHFSSTPVINMESALWHPLQGFADASIWAKHLGPDLRGKTLTLSWAPHPKALPMAVPNSVLLMGAACGMNVRLASPPGFSLSSGIVNRCRTVCADNGGTLQEYEVQKDALESADVVVAKSWGGVEGYADRGQEERRRAAHHGWRIDSEKMGWTNNAGFMHCLPVRRNVVVTDEVIDGGRSWVIEEAHYRLWTAIAVMEKLLGGG